MEHQEQQQHQPQQESERKKLQLKPKGSAPTSAMREDASGLGSSTSSDVFGGARPRELNVSQEREAQIRDKEAEIDQQRQAMLSAGRSGGLASPGSPGSNIPFQGYPHPGRWQHQQAPYRGGRGGGYRGGYQGSHYQPHPHHPRNSSGNGEDEEGFKVVEPRKITSPKVNAFGEGGHYGGYGQPPLAHPFAPLAHQSYGAPMAYGRGGFHHQTQRPPRAAVPGEGYICNLCKQPGHWIQNCALYIRSRQLQQQQQQPGQMGSEDQTNRDQEFQQPHSQQSEDFQTESHGDSMNNSSSTGGENHISDSNHQNININDKSNNNNSTKDSRHSIGNDPNANGDDEERAAATDDSQQSQSQQPNSHNETSVENVDFSSLRIGDAQQQQQQQQRQQRQFPHHPQQQPFAHQFPPHFIPRGPSPYNPRFGGPRPFNPAFQRGHSGPYHHNQHRPPRPLSHQQQAGGKEGGEIIFSNSFAALAQRRPEDAKPRSAIPPEGYTCHICNITGHWIQECPQKPPAPVQSFPTHMHRDSSSEHMSRDGSTEQRVPFDSIPPQGYLCKICEIPGHFLRNCPDYRQSMRSNNANVVTPTEETAM